MNRKFLPAILMLTAGAITCIINLVRQYPMQDQLVSLLIVLIVFYILGSVMKLTLDTFEKQNEVEEPEEGEVIEKELEEALEEAYEQKEGR